MTSPTTITMNRLASQGMCPKGGVKLGLTATMKVHDGPEARPFLRTATGSLLCQEDW
jgi:hypothetical protein